MLEEMTTEEWEDWQAFMAVEPFPHEQVAMQHADYMALLRTVHRDPKQHPKGYTLQECLLRMGDDMPPAPTRNMDWKTLKSNFFKAVGVTGADGKPRPSRKAEAPKERPVRPPKPKRPEPPMVRPRRHIREKKGRLR